MERAPSPATYVVIDLVLVVLTVFTVGLSFIEEPALGHLLGGLVIGVVKAALVVLFFMHALRSRGKPARSSWSRFSGSRSSCSC